MRGKWLFVLIFFGCQSDFIPEGLYDYQVERLLSGGDSKVWFQVVNSPNCQDSTKLFVQLLSNSLDDTVAISRLNLSQDCSVVDTLFIGNADASSFEGAILFSDTLNFSDGSFWTVERITSNEIVIRSEIKEEFRWFDDWN